MPFHEEIPAGVTFGDIAAGDGYIGIVADLPGGAVGLALFNEHGRERRIVHIPSERCQLVKRSWEWSGLSDRSREVAERSYSRQNARLERDR